MISGPQSPVVAKVVSTKLPTKWGEFDAIVFQQKARKGARKTEMALALVLGDLKAGIPLLRIHSQCATGEALGSLRCDCGGQLQRAMREISRERRGLLIYEFQEGRGIGLSAKLQAYRLQDLGLDTIEANHALGYKSDYRDFTLPITILKNLEIRCVRLLSNNPQKAHALREGGIQVAELISCEIPANRYSRYYLQTKVERMGHRLNLGLPERQEACRITQDRRQALANIRTAVDELKAGHMIVVVDDEDRENEGDLVMAADTVTPQAINFMATHGRGLICLAMSGARLDELDLPLMSRVGESFSDTAFTASIDAKGYGVTTGISAFDRAQTIRAAVDPHCCASDFARPGHIFPLRSRDGGVLERRGHTEAAVDLARLAGMSPAGVICEIINDDGQMARVPDLKRFCMRHHLQMATIADLVLHRIERATY